MESAIARLPERYHAMPVGAEADAPEAPDPKLPVAILFVGGYGGLGRHALFTLLRMFKRHFRGVVFDIDPVFANSEEWYESIPQEARPQREQPYYHLFAENEESSYIAYVSQQNLVADASGNPVEHPALDEIFEDFDGERYRLRHGLSH